MVTASVLGSLKAYAMRRTREGSPKSTRSCRQERKHVGGKREEHRWSAGTGGGLAAESGPKGWMGSGRTCRHCKPLKIRSEG